MKYTTIFEKIVCIFNTISNSWLYIAFLGITTVLIILLGMKKISKKTCFLFNSMACFLVFGYTLYQYFKPISNMIDDLIDHLFTDIYFPSAFAYLFILVVINIITIGSLLNPRKEKIYKTIHGICFISTNFILTIILEMISKNEIDIFSKTSLYSNTDLVILLEFSMNIFILWCISLLAIYITNIVTERITIAKENRVLEKDAVDIAPLEVDLSFNNLEEEYLETNQEEQESSSIASISANEIDTTANHFIPSYLESNYQKEENNLNQYSKTKNIASVVIHQEETEPTYQANPSYDYSFHSLEDNNTILEPTFDLSSFIPRKQEMKPIQNFNNNLNTNEIFEKILNNELPVIKEENQTIKESKPSIIEEEKNTYTLNDYRIFNKMLKDIREHNQSNSVRIDKDLEYRLITKYSTETYNMFKKMLKIYSN